MESTILDKEQFSLVSQENSTYRVLPDNSSEMLDQNMTNMDPKLMWEILQDQNGIYVTEYTDIIFITCFAVLIIFGAVGNGLVCYVVVKNPHMRTPRNIFIINLAISDLTLCLFTQPLNLYRLLNNQWLLGGFMCKFVVMCQGTNVFVSTISITAIALDRFQVIVYPTKDSMKKLGAASALCSIWIISFLMSSPLLIFAVYTVDQPVIVLPVYFFRCLEDITLMEEKGAYSVASMIVQYILPIAIVIIAHARICNKLKYRMVNQTHGGTSFQKRKNERQSRRKRKTNITLSLIAIVFALSWLPLNLFNILTEFQFSHFKHLNINLAYKICHMLVLSSACTNPMIYGWLNDNFRNEFMKVLSCCACCVKLKSFVQRVCCCSPTHGDVPVIVFTKESTDNNGALPHYGS
ncbi:neuropeptide F receptor-like [Pecten maximus]|uniref:neuropeptide F receptor-like n=1 Tax=Pecten maximus TaxID=6579 RepID=UPI001458CD38|nr:neuropeptide F receptor-like [Pecten maximus]